MRVAEYQEAVQAGLGRGIIHASKNNTSAFRDVILDACINCYAVDPQSEGTRASYMLELVSLTPDRSFYLDKVLKALPAGADDWSAVQRFRLASFMSRDGDDNARRVMYNSFDPGPQMAEETAIDFVQMDGLDGLEFAASKVGALLRAVPDQVDQGHLFFFASETFGEQQTLDFLREAGKTNEDVEAYRLAVEASRKAANAVPSEMDRVKALRFEELRPELARTKDFYLSRWGKQATGEDLATAAAELMKASSVEEQICYLRIFSRRPFPLHHSRLLELSLSNDERLAIAAAIALGNVTNPEVRALSFQLVETCHQARLGAIRMLSRNWKAGDNEVALDWFRKEQDRHIRHAFELDCRNLWEDHPDLSTEGQMLLTLYERGPCSACRWFVIRRLIELQSLPDYIREECAYDENDDVRKMVEIG